MDRLINYNTLVVLAGTGLLGAGAGAIGTFAVLRRRALTGDALAHAALPGLCLGFLIWGERNTYVMLSGALVSGVIGVATIAALRRGTRIKEDAAIGVVLSVFFGAGIVLSRSIQNHATWSGSKAGLDSYVLGTTAGMTAGDVYLIAAASAACLAVLVLVYKEFKLLSFDIEFGQSQGWPVLALDLVMMSLLAVMVVIGLPSVGVVLIAALLILPAVSARFWTDRLGGVLWLSSGFGTLVGIVGTALSAHFSKLPTGPTVVLVGTTIFLISLLAAPRKGLVTRLLAQRRFARQLAERMLLHAMYERSAGEAGYYAIGMDEIVPAGAPHAGATRAALAAAMRRGEVAGERDRYALTALGRRRAAGITRDLRLWELFMTEHTDEAAGLKHSPGESLADVLPRETVAELTEVLRRRGQLPSETPERGEEAL